MLFFKKKPQLTPEEAEAARIEKLRKLEAERRFGGAIMTPVGTLELADITVIHLEPDAQELVMACHKKGFIIPYKNLRGMVVATEEEIANHQSAITLEEMENLLEDPEGAGQFIGPMDPKQHFRGRCFIRIDYVDEFAFERSVMFIAYSMRGPYMASNRLFAAEQFTENVDDIVLRYRALEDGAAVEETNE